MGHKAYDQKARSDNLYCTILFTLARTPPLNKGRETMPPSAQQSRSFTQDSTMAWPMGHISPRASHLSSPSSTPKSNIPRRDQMNTRNAMSHNFHDFSSDLFATPQGFLNQLLRIENVVPRDENDAKTCMICLESYGSLNPVTGSTELPVRLPCNHLGKAFS